MPKPYFLNNGAYQMEVPREFEIAPFFMAHELACPQSKLIQVEPVFLCRLVTLRFIVDHTMLINSACRTPTYNKLLEGAHKNSLHQTINPKHKNALTGHALKMAAVDIKTTGWAKAKIKRFVNEAEKLGLSVGIAKTFIHLDGRDIAGLPQHRFYYGSAREWFASI